MGELGIICSVWLNPGVIDDDKNECAQYDQTEENTA